MADFRAKIIAELDTATASNQLNGLVSQIRALSPLNIDVNLNLNQSSQALANLLTQLRQVGSIGMNQFNSLNNVSNSLNNSFNNIRINMRNTQNQMRQFNETQARTFGYQMTAWANNNSKAVRAYGQQLDSLQSRLRIAISNQDVNAVRQIREEFRLLQAQARASGDVGKTFSDSLKSSLGTAAKFASSYFSVYKVFSTIKQGVNTIVELDDALVDLQKTSTASASQLNSFYREANDIAKEYGTTTKQIIQGAADWSRLGYNLEESKTMSRLSSQFAAISPGMTVERSTEGLVSTMKAFGIETDDVLDGVMSKVNAVGRMIA